MSEELMQVSSEAEMVAPDAAMGDVAMDDAAATPIEGSGGSETVVGQAARVIDPPAAGETEVIRLAPGERFELAANPATVSLVVDGNNLVLGFDLDSNGTPDSFVILEDLVMAAASDNPPVLMVAGQPIGVDLLIGNAQALGQADQGGPGATLETATGETGGAETSGYFEYSDNLGDTINLLIAQGVIPPVELEFGIPEFDDRIDVVEEENDPPIADPVLTPASVAIEGGEGGGDLPEDLQDALNALGIAGAGQIPADWTTLGDITTTSASFGITPYEGSAQLTMIASGADETEIEAFFGLAPGTLDSLAGVDDATDGSAIKTTVSVQAGDQIVFQVNFLDLEQYDGSESYNDFAFLFIDGAVIKLADVLGTDSAPIETDIGTIAQTGYNEWTIIFAAGGDFTLGFGMMNEDDSSVDSALLVDSIVHKSGETETLLTGFEGGSGEVVFFKQLVVSGEIGDDDSGVIADFGGADSETSLENLVFTLQSNPTFGQLILVTAGGTTSFLTPGDTFSSEDTVWWIATEDQIADFLDLPGSPEFLPNVDFLYTVTDEAGASAVAPVVITLPPPQDPRASLGIFQDDCLSEDTEGKLLFSAHPTDGASKISEIVISGFPTGDAADAWVVEPDSVDIFGYTLNVDYTTSYNAATGELTITFITANFSLGEGVQGTVDVTPNPDSDVDRTLTIEATAINGAGSATDIENSVIMVDAIADGAEGGPGDDGDSAHLSVVATVTDSEGEVPENGTFQADEIGTLTVHATFDDFLDGSETHTLYVYAPAGFEILGLIGDLPAGVTLTASGPGFMTFDVETLNGVGEVDLSFEVQNVSAGEGEATFYAYATAEETNTPSLIPGDMECDGGEGSNFAYVVDDAVATVAIVQAPEVSLSLYGGEDCIEEDSTDNQVNVSVNPDGDDLLTEVVITGLQSDWSYDFTGLGGAGITLDDSVPGQVTVTFDTPSNATYNGSFLATPPADSDVDHPTLTVTASVEDPSDPALTADGNDTLDIHVDAVVDAGALVSGAPDTSSGGAAVDLNLTLAPQGGNAGNPAGDAFNGGGFDTDGSESVTKVVVTLSGDAGAVLTSSNLVLFGDLLTSNVGQVWTFEGTQAQLVSLMSTLQVDPSDDFEGDITVDVDVTTTEVATEAGNPVPDGDGSNGTHGYECDDENNSVTESFQFTVSVDNTEAPLAAIGVQEGDCLFEDTEGTLAFSADPQGDGDTITQIVISGFPGSWDVDTASLQLDGLTTPADYTFSFVGGVLTINLTGASADATVTGTIDVTPNADSDLDASLTINATAEDGDASSTSDNDPTVIPVDAVADGGALVSGTPDTSDSGAVVDLNLALAPQGGNPGNPGGDAFNGGGFDTDGSEAVTKVVVTLSGDAGAALTSSNLVLFGDLLTSNVGQVWTFEGTQAQLVSLMSTLQVNPSDDFEGDVTVDIDVTTTELATVAGNPDAGDTNGVHGYECTDANNSVTESFQFTVPVDSAAEPVATIGVFQDDCLVEDTEGTLAFTADPQGAGDTITEIVISGFPSDWTVDTASLQLSDGGALVSPGDYTFSFVAGVLTITLTGAAVDATVTGTIDVTPGEDSDVDGLLTINATAEDGIASATTNNDPTTIVVDAVADGVSGSFGDDGDTSHLSLDIEVTDNGGDGSFQTGELGVLTITATFDDYQDGSEEHLVTVTAPDGYFIGGSISLPAGVTIDSNDGTTLVLRVDSLDGDGQDGVGSFTATFSVTNVAAEEGSGDFTGVASAEELNTNLDETQGDAECDLENNYAEATDTETVTADDPDREILNTGIITNTNSQGQKGIITFYDQGQILMNAFAGYIVFSIEGQALSQANDTGFIIEADTEYTYGFEADPANGSRIGLDELSLEGVDLTEPANIFGMGDVGTAGATNFAMSGRFEPNGTEVQVGTASTDGTTGANSVNDPTAGPTVNYLFGDLGNDTLNGGAGADILNGAGGNDSLLGGGGTDILVYGVGDTIDGGAGDDLVRIDAIGATITTFNDGGDTFINLTSILTEFNYVSTNIDNVEGLLITDQPTFKAGDVVQGVTLVDSDGDGDIDADDHAFMADIGVRVALEASDVIDHADGDVDVLWIQGNEGDVVNLLDSDGTNDWHYAGTSGDFATYTWGANPGNVLATVHIEVGTIGDSSIDVQINGTTVLDDGQLVP